MLPSSPRLSMSAATESYDIPTTYLADLVRVVERYGVSCEALLEGMTVAPAQLEDPNARISLPEVDHLVDRAIELTADPALAISMGLQMQVSSHGYLGFAAMTARTVREALELAVRFAPLRFPALALELEVFDEQAAVILEERTNFGSAREFLLVTLAVGFTRMAQALLGKSVRGHAELRISQPAYFEEIRRMIPGTVSFEAEVNRLVFAGSLLDEPIVTANPSAMSLAREQCERELAEVSRKHTYAQRVREAATVPSGFLGLDEVAKRLATSPRTLKRRLAEEGTTFSGVLDELRRGRALELVREPELSLEEIAERLGYSDVANFSRAFRRWTSVAPGAYRRGVR
jgi:AraC-like DNA-binding protein